MSGFTQSQLDALNAALVSGKRAIEFSGPQGSRRITYASTDEMLKVKALLERELGLVASRTSVRMSSDKGTG